MMEHLEEKVRLLEDQVHQWERKFAAQSGQLDSLCAIVDNARLPIAMKDGEGRYVYVNREFERLCQVPLTVLRGKDDFEVFPEPVARLFREQDTQVIEAGTTLQFEETVPLLGEPHSFITEKFPVFDEHGGLRGVVAICTDITRHKDLEHRLANDQERLAVTLRSLSDGVITTDPESCVLLLNRRAADLTGWTEEEARGRPLPEVLTLSREGGGGNGNHLLEEILRNAPPVEAGLPGVADTDAILTARDGTRRPVTITVALLPNHDQQAIGRVLVLRDDTLRRGMEQELLKTRKLESLQVLAGGIAHDFNNFLAAILGNLSLCTALTRKGGGKVPRLLGEAERATLLARNLTQQLLTFAKGGEPVKTVAALPEVIRDSASFLLRGTQTRCEYAIDADLWPVEVDTGQMSQVIQNVILNASQAMGGAGVIRIRCGNVEFLREEIPGLAPGRYVRLAIADAGPGIPRDLQERIFDPFFSTKPGGTGLGLAITHSIVKRHGGHIGAHSATGAGCTFTIHLPAAEGVPLPHPAPAAPAPATGTASTPATAPRRRILIMDDDSQLRTMLLEILVFLGYDVVACEDGAEAIRLYAKHLEAGKRFDAVIMDLTIPGGMGGREAVGGLRQLDPMATVVVSSGFSNDPIMSRFADFGFAGVLPKPYRIEDLESLFQGLFSQTARVGPPPA
ncbi:MAG: PAS domain-containing protein [Candidatus Riflebacteria bacterium]|nr:PAS domain-containing protein [Candidatus Riflebacteria bacterium]